MCAPSSVGAMEPVGMTKASTVNARKMNARMNATRIDSSVSLTLLSLGCDGEWVGGLGDVAGRGAEVAGAEAAPLTGASGFTAGCVMHAIVCEWRGGGEVGGE